MTWPLELAHHAVCQTCQSSADDGFDISSLPVLNSIFIPLLRQEVFPRVVTVMPSLEDIQFYIIWSI